MWAANRVYGVPGRPFLKKLPRQIILALVLLVAMGLIATVVVLTGPDRRICSGGAIGLGDQALTAYGILRWPLLFVLAALPFSVLYHFAPNADTRRFRRITLGGFFCVVTGLVATFGVTLYVGTPGSYNATYGALAGVVVFLIWLWIFDLALLVGLEVDVEVLRRRGFGDQRR